MTMAIVVHGGAGRASADDLPAEAVAGCEAAARVGYALLQSGGRSLDAVQAAVRALEDDPQFNAGTGACLTEEGEIELDASLMEGQTLRFGGVGAVRGVLHPIELARAVMERTAHALLVGSGAEAFAHEVGLEIVPTARLITEKALRRWERRRGAPADPEGGTVGAVALDSHGNLAAATSTGGMMGKRRGRVGDTPLPGAGTYADGRGAASATGHGEAILRVCLTHRVCQQLQAGQSAQHAAEEGLEALARIGGEGGLIALDQAGGLGIAFNTERMARAWILPSGSGAGFGR